MTSLERFFENVLHFDTVGSAPQIFSRRAKMNFNDSPFSRKVRNALSSGDGQEADANCHVARETGRLSTAGLSEADQLLWQKLASDLEVEQLQKTVELQDAYSSLVNESCEDLVGCQLGKFVIKEQIARGGMGVILRSEDTELDREVAVKLLLKHHHGKAQLHQQFNNEVRITSRLQHPGIIPIYEMGEHHDGRPFFAMKLVHGKTFEELLHDRSAPDQNLPRMLKIFEQVCQTLSYTHASGVVHLDIKPANVMVGTFGEVHLMDWGLARSVQGLCCPGDVSSVQVDRLIAFEQIPAIRPGVADDLCHDKPRNGIWGTPAYMSPEQARGQCMDVRADVFGLGAVLCEILTGIPPYTGDGLMMVCCKAAAADLQDAIRRLEDCGADQTLVRLAVKCLSESPPERPANAGMVANEVTLYLETLLQRAESDLERFFDLSLDLFCIAGLDGYFRRVNSNFPRVLGYSEKELVSQPFIDFVHPEDRDQTIAVMSELKEGNPVARFRNRYLAADDSWRCLEWTAKSIPAEGIIFAVARDLSDA